MSRMTKDQIEAALKAGIINQDQADKMRAELEASAVVADMGLEATPSETSENSEIAYIGDEENMRFVRSFSDVFIAIGLGILGVGLFTFAGMAGGGFGFLLGIPLIWLMCEYFGRKKRAHLPTLILALMYLLFVHAAMSALIDLPSAKGVAPALVTILAMLVFYWRFRLPFSIALIALSCVILVFALFHEAISSGTLMLLSGFALFVSAVAYDMRDTDRKTRFADNAFWLHFTAAPLIVHGFAILALTPKTTKIWGFLPMVQLGKSDAALLLLVIGLLTLVGLAINRRALIVSSLGYAAFAIGFLIKDTGLNFGSIIAATLLLLGGGIVFLGVGWHQARRGLLHILPRTGILAKVFPPDQVKK